MEYCLVVDSVSSMADVMAACWENVMVVCLDETKVADLVEQMAGMKVLMMVVD